MSQGFLSITEDWPIYDHLSTRLLYQPEALSPQENDSKLCLPET